jgi:hypothetical protein
MPRNSLVQGLAILDVQATWSWGITIPSIPGQGDTRTLTSKAISTTLPGSTIEQNTLEAQGGIKLNFAGRRIWEQTWNITIIETRDASTRDQWLSWMDFTRNPIDGTGNYKSLYAVPIELALYDDAGVQSRSIKIVNAFPTAISAPNLDQQNGIVQYDMTLVYDYVEEVNGAG